MINTPNKGKALGLLLLAGLLAGGEAQADPEERPDFLSSMEIGGHLHTLATYHETEAAGGTEEVSDIFVNSLEVGLAASPYRFLDANVVWLLEEAPGGGSPGQPFAVDQAFVTLSGTPHMLKRRENRRDMAGPPWYLQAGKFYIPFATDLNYHTFDVVSEPPTLVLGETLESGVRLGYYPDGIHVFGGVFGGRGQEGAADRIPSDEPDQDEKLNDFFAGLSLQGGPGKVAVRWMSNLNNSITLQDEVGHQADGDPTARTEDANPGLAVYVRTRAGPVTLQGAYVSAQNEYEQGLLAGHRPRAATGELTYRFDGIWEATAVYQHTGDWPGHARRGIGAVVGARLAPGLSVAAEYLERSHHRAHSSIRGERLASLLLDVEFGEMFGPLVRTRASAFE